MKQVLKLLLITLILNTLLSANTDRALYIEKYASEKKVALVIGNSNYDNKSLSKLKNPINDARAVRDKLKEKNFEVLYLEDATQRETDKMVRKFSDKLKNSGVGLFYFAGHGLEVDKKNYLIPIGADVSDEVDVKYEALGVNEIVDRMKRSGTRLNLVVLDACRNNPFKRGAGGLAAMENAKGTLIAYATDSGSTASDNPNEKNGLFTKHFLKALDEPLNQRELFHNIRKGVYDASGGQQLPYLNDGTIGDFFFTVTDIKYQSSVSLQDEKQQFYTLTINPTPPNATVQITNISPKYHDGIKLKKGSYNIKVSKDGYISKSGTIELKSDLNINVELEKEKVVFQAKEKLKDVYVDKTSKLMWQDDTSAKTTKKNWDDAIKHCQNLKFAEYSDWRLPTRDELKKLYPQKNNLKNVTADRYWSSSPRVSDSSLAWLVGFKYGGDYWNHKSYKYLVRCVRDSK